MKLFLFIGFFLFFTISFVFTSDVIELTHENFKETITGKDVFLEFFAPWCGHCKRLAPTWEEFATKLKENKSPIGVGKMDCTVSDHQSICSQYGVRGYPTLIFQNKEGEIFRYKGERTIDSFEAFAANPGVSDGKPDSWNFSFQELQKMVVEDAQHLLKTKKAIIGIILAFGIMIGFTLGALVCLFFRTPTKPKKE